MIELTSRDRDILDTLARRVRMLTLSQVQRVWWEAQADGRRLAVRRLKQLQAAGFVQLNSAAAHPELELIAPAAAWSPGEAAPNFPSVSYRLKIRWNQAAQLTSFITAAPAAFHHFGGYPTRIPRRSEVTHDLHLSAVYLKLLMNEPGTAQAWVFEQAYRAEIRRPGEKVPDAVIARAGDVMRVVEFGGAYSPAKLAAFHAFCARRRWGYDVW